MTRLGDILNLGHALELTIVIFLFVDSEEDMGWGRKQNLELLSDVDQYSWVEIETLGHHLSLMRHVH